MRMMVKKVGQEVQEVDLKNCYETLKDAVGGWIEAVYLDKMVILWCNEEGKLIGLPHNFSINGQSIEGDVIFTGDKGDGDNKALTDLQVAYIKSLCDKKPTEFEKYIDTFFSEKDLPLDVWTFTEGNYVVQIDNRTVVANLRGEKFKPAQDKIRGILLSIDFHNGNVNHFLNQIAKGMFEEQLKYMKKQYGGLFDGLRSEG